MRLVYAKLSKLLKKTRQVTQILIQILLDLNAILSHFTVLYHV